MSTTVETRAQMHQRHEQEYADLMAQMATTTLTPKQKYDRYRQLWDAQAVEAQAIEPHSPPNILFGAPCRD